MLLLRRCAVLFMMVAFLSLKACSTEREESFLPTDEGALRSRATPFSGTGCDLEPSVCYALDSAISQMENHANSFCADLGAASRVRFNRSSGGYVPGEEQSGIISYVEMEPDDNMPYGWGPSNGNVYVNQEQLMDRGYSISYLAAKVVAHEQVHHDGWPPSHSPPPPPLPCGDW